jgi:hypothetical protein
MATFETGDLVVLTCGSMRMAVESVDGDRVACVWCHEGIIGRDSFDARLLKRWEHREEHGERSGPARPYRGDREGGGKPYKPRPPRAEGSAPPRRRKHDDEGEDRPRARRYEGEGEDRPARKTGWDGKPREKKYFRKEE